MFFGKEGIMGKKDIIIMSPEELRRVSVINQSIGGLITQVKAAEVIGGGI